MNRVKLGRDTETGQDVALKIMKHDIGVSNKGFLELVENEVQTMMNLDHPNIVNCLGYEESATLKKQNGTEKDVLYIALELATGGELFDFIATTGKFSEPVARYYFKQLIEGLDHIHSKGVSHRDIKPENVLLDSEFNLKLADFGFSSS